MQTVKSMIGLRTLRLNILYAMKEELWHAIKDHFLEGTRFTEGITALEVWRSCYSILMVPKSTQNVNVSSNSRPQEVEKSKNFDQALGLQEQPHTNDEEINGHPQESDLGAMAAKI
ncbi:MAG: hypothetical protein Q9213_003149 [Squamulea squamosa]